MLIGLVKWFDPDKGFGIIGTPDEGEFFMHVNNFTNRPQNIPKGTAVIFQKKIDNKKNRNTAVNCRVVGEIEDWKMALTYLGKPDNVTIEVEITGSKNGKPYHRKGNQSFSLMNLAIKQLFKEKGENEISNIITDYFDDGLYVKHFITYCEFAENRITKKFPIRQATTLLKDIFTHFGNNLNEEILFQVWKNKKFKFISYTEKDEYEIPEKVLKNFINEISVAELKRIKNFSFGSEFCIDFITSKFRNISGLTSDEIKTLYSFLELTSEEEREKYKLELDSFYTQKITAEIIEQANKLPPIKDSNDLYNYNRLSQLVLIQIGDEEKTKIQNELNKIITSKSSEEYKPELWIKGIIEDASFEFISIIFLDSNTQNDKRTTILSKLLLNQQLELLRSYSEKTNFEKAFDSLENLLKKENSLGYGFELSEKLFNTEFWKDKKCNDLVDLFIQYVNAKSSEEEKYELFFKGLVKDIPQNLVKQNFSKLDEDDCRKILASQPENKRFILEILQSKTPSENISSLDWVYDLGKIYLDVENFNLLDKKIFNSIAQPEYL